MKEVIEGVGICLGFACGWVLLESVWEIRQSLKRLEKAALALLKAQL